MRNFKEKKRCFIAIDFSEEVRKKIRKIQDMLPEFKGKKTELENIHLTLKFLGEIDEERVEEVRKRLREIKFKEFRFKINKIGVFSEKFIRIIWLGVDEQGEGKKLWELQKEIDEKLKDLFEEERRFMGHITIGRVKSCDKKKFLSELKKINFEEIEVRVKKFKLKKSELRPEGPVYEIIEEYELEEKGGGLGLRN